MIITAENPQTDPLTAAVVPMAVRAGGGPVVQYSPGTHDFRGHKTVIFLGHGHPGGELVNVDPAQLTTELADSARGLEPGSDLRLWCCFGTAGPSFADTLVAKVQHALTTNGIRDVTISGVPGALYTDIRDDSLWCGPTKTTRNADSAEAKVIIDIEGHARVEAGLMNAVMKMKAGKYTDTPDLKTVNATVGGHPVQFEVMQTPMVPRSIDDALSKLLKHGKLAAMPVTDVDRVAAITTAYADWYRLFLGHPVIRGYIADKVINPWADVQTTVRS